MKLSPLPILSNPPARTRLGAAAPVGQHHDAGAGTDWRQAYLKLRQQQEQAADAPPTAPVLIEPPGRLGASHRRREQEQEAPRDIEPPQVGPIALAAVPDAVPVPILPAAPLAPTTERIVAALRQIDAAAPSATPAARVWQVELPATGPAWQLRVEQAQPLAPLNLELRVPPVLQTQARQQLGDLDKRLRDAGHDVLRSRLRTGKKRGPVDGVPS